MIRVRPTILLLAWLASPPFLLGAVEPDRKPEGPAHPNIVFIHGGTMSGTTTRAPSG